MIGLWVGRQAASNVAVGKNAHTRQNTTKGDIRPLAMRKTREFRQFSLSRFVAGLRQEATKHAISLAGCDKGRQLRRRNLDCRSRNFGLERRTKRVERGSGANATACKYYVR